MLDTSKRSVVSSDIIYPPCNATFLDTHMTFEHS
jgi:hypothetical protein